MYRSTVHYEMMEWNMGIFAHVSGVIGAAALFWEKKQDSSIFRK